jgi:hypothetical protein
MWRLGRRATKVLQRPGTFALAVLKGFRANQGVLLAGAVAYYTLLSLVPLLILSLMALSHLFSEDQLLQTLREYLEFVVPGQSSALVQEQQFSFWWTGVRPKGHTGLEKDWAAILGRLGLIQGRDGGARQPAERRAALL